MLKLSGVTSVYGGIVEALKEVSLTLQAGKIAVLLGGNGAGKSTLLKSISGVIRTEEGEITEGSIEFDGRHISRLDPEQIARLGICHVLQGRSVFPQLTAEENLLMGAYLRRNRRDVAADLKRVYGYFPVLLPLARRKGGYLSGGEQQMLVIARALMAHPKLLLLDEPSLGLAPLLIKDIFAVLRMINAREGTTLLIAEQNTAASLAIADCGFLLQNGRVVGGGEATDLRERAAVKGAYLGLQEDGSVFSRQFGTIGGDSASQK